MNDNSNFAKHNNKSWNTTSPEIRFDGCGPISNKSDMWSLGAVLYWMIYKKYPYK